MKVEKIMKEIIVTTQAELDALPTKFKKFTKIIIKDVTPDNRIVVRVARENSSVEVRDNSSVEAYDHSLVKAHNHSSVEAYDDSLVEAYDDSLVEAYKNSSVKSYNNSSVKTWSNSSVLASDDSLVEAYDDSLVVANGNSSVVANGKSSVVAWDHSSVDARDHSSVEAWRNSSVKAYDHSSVVAWSNSSVEAMGHSSVEARGDSSVKAYGIVGVHLQSTHARIVLFMCAVCWVIVDGKVQKKSKTATIIKPKKSIDSAGWLESQGVKKEKGSVIIFKKVSVDYKTREGTPNETTWTIGTTLTHPAWSPNQSECGEGKFHACSKPYFCDEFRSEEIGDKYLAIKVQIKDLYAWKDPSYPHKIAFRKGTVLYQCDKLGKKKVYLER